MSQLPYDEPARPAVDHGVTSQVAGAERIALGRSILLEDASYAEIAETFRALADRTRTKLVYSLLQQELCTGELAAVAGVSESVVSQHLRVLRELRLVRSRRDGKLVFHSLDDAHIRILLSVALDHVRDVERANDGLDSMLALFPMTSERRKQSVEEAGFGA